MSKLIKPEGYQALLGMKQTEQGIKLIKDFFQQNLSTELRLRRVPQRVGQHPGPAVVKHLRQFAELLIRARAGKLALAAQHAVLPSHILQHIAAEGHAVGADVPAEADLIYSRIVRPDVVLEPHRR